MLILGIETSCDETAAAVVKDGREVVSNVVASSLPDHAKFGGVIPEIASRRQMEFIHSVVNEALTRADVSLDQVDRVAVTMAPGLIGSLLVGICYARALSFAAQKKILEVDHIKAHLYANFLNLPNSPNAATAPQLPAVGLVVSGGHSSLYYLKNFTHYKLLGQTRDDAAGEAFDKVARIMGLGYPGGPVIDKLAREGKNTQIRFAPAQMPESFDFSFSGVKTAVLYYHRQHHQDQNFSVNQVAYAFQDSVVSILVKKSIAACRKKKTQTLLVGGGVAANSALRARLIEEGRANGIDVHFPPMPLCLDNAAMIAGLAYHLN